MVSVNSKLLRFTDKDLDFTVSHAARGSAEPERLKRAIVEDDELRAAGVGPGTIRLSVGIEDVDDLIWDQEQGFACVAGSLPSAGSEAAST